MLFFHCYCYLLFTVRASSLELFVHLLCEKKKDTTSRAGSVPLHSLGIVVTLGG